MSLADTINQIKNKDGKNGVFKQNNPKVSSRFINMGKLLSRNGINDKLVNDTKPNMSIESSPSKINNIDFSDKKYMSNNFFSDSQKTNTIEPYINKPNKNNSNNSNNIVKGSFTPEYKPLTISSSPNINKITTTNTSVDKLKQNEFTKGEKLDKVISNTPISSSFKFDERNNDNKELLEEMKNQTKIQRDILAELRKKDDDNKGLLDFLDDFKKKKKTPTGKPSSRSILKSAKDGISKAKGALKNMGEKALSKLGGLADKSKSIIKTTANIAKNAAAKGMTSSALATGAKVLSKAVPIAAAVGTGWEAGQAIGGAIYDKYQDTSFVKGIGATVAKVGAFFGNKEAKEAVAINSKEKDLSKEQLNEKAKANKNALIEEMNAAGITDQKERAMVLANAHHETGGFKKTAEGKYSADKVWEMRGKTLSKKGVTLEQLKSEEKSGGKDAMYEYMYGDAYRDKGYKMGNTEKGDAAKYKGRGLYQLTGKSNYAAASKAIGVDLVKNPELAEDPKIAAKIAMWHWKKSGGGEKARRGDVVGSRKAVNGGIIGIDDVNSNYLAYLKTDTYKTDVVKNNTTPASKDSKVASTTPASKDSKVASTTPASKDSKVASTTPASKDSKVASTTPASKDSKVASTTPASKDSKVSSNLESKTPIIDSIIKTPISTTTENIKPNSKMENFQLGYSDAVNNNTNTGNMTINTDISNDKQIPVNSNTPSISNQGAMNRTASTQGPISSAQKSKEDVLTPNIEVRKQTSTIQRVFDRDANLIV